MSRLVMSCLTTMLVAALGAGTAHAQMRRSSPDGASGPPRDEAPKGILRNPRRPYAGVWDGTFTLRSGPAGGHDIPVVMVPIVAGEMR